MFCHLLFWLVSGLVLLYPVAWLPIPQQPAKGSIPCYALHSPRLKTTPNLGHTYIMLKCDQDAQHFQDHIMSYYKYDYVLDPLVWPDYA